MSRMTVAIGSIAVLAVVFVAGCDSSAKSSGGLIAKGSGASTVDTGQFNAAAAGGTADAIGAGANAPTAASAPDAAATPVQAAPDSKLDLAGPSLIRTADITVSTASVSQQADQAERIVSNEGGSIDGDQRTSGKNATATLTLRVPPSLLSSTLSKLSALGKEQSRHLSTQDVTSTVADVDSRVRSAAAAIDQLQQLYAKAQRVSDIIAIETQLTEREADLESMQAQQRALAGQIAMATVTLNLVTPAIAQVVHHAASGGFVGGLKHGWHAFTRSAAGLFTGIGAVLPFAAVLAVLGAGWLTVRRRRPTPAMPEPAPVPTP